MWFDLSDHPLPSYSSQIIASAPRSAAISEASSAHVAWKI
jgi:hypothetical protein